MKRSHAPIFWLLFGAGGMLAALLGPALVFVTGIAAPLEWTVFARLFEYRRATRFVGHPIVATGLFLVISLFAWHAAHRLLCLLHDLGMRKGIGARLSCYGGALLITIASATALLDMTR